MSGLLYSVRFRLDHRWAPARMSAYVDDELAANGRARMERHTSDCPECRQLLSSLMSMLRRLQGLPPVRDGQAPDVAAAVRRRLREPT